MENAIKENLKQYFDDIDGFSVEITEAKEMLEVICPVLESDEMFWNHYLSLIVRVRNSEQNDLPFENNGDISEASIDKAREFIDGISLFKVDTITDFEQYLLAIYFEKQVGKEVGSNG